MSSKLAMLKENLETENESIFQPEAKKQKKAGRKPKLKGTKLSRRVTFLLSEQDAQILEMKRRAGEFGEIDESTFIREWLTRTGMFEKSSVSNNAWENLPQMNS